MSGFIFCRKTPRSLSPNLRAFNHIKTTKMLSNPTKTPPAKPTNSKKIQIAISEFLGGVTRRRRGSVQTPEFLIK